jgi:hypothetical protein
VKLLGYERCGANAIRSRRRRAAWGARWAAIDPGSDPLAEEQDQAQVSAAWRACQHIAAKLLVGCDGSIGALPWQIGIDHGRFFSCRARARSTLRG